jgi:hypothetical protein
MVQRMARRGPRAGRPFWGCSRFPRCRGTRDVDTPEGREAADRASGPTSPDDVIDADLPGDPDIVAPSLSCLTHWYDGTLERRGWEVRYRPVSGSLRSVEASTSVAGSMVGWFACSGSATHPGRPPSALVLTVLRKILGRGSAPPIDPDAEQRLLSFTRFRDRAFRVPFKGDIALRLDDAPSATGCDRPCM